MRKQKKNNNDKETRVREWINTGVAIAILIVMIIGIFLGYVKLDEINVNLKEINAEKITTKELEIIDPYNGSSFKIEKINETHWRMSG